MSLEPDVVCDAEGVPKLIQKLEHDKFTYNFKATFFNGLVRFFSSINIYGLPLIESDRLPSDHEFTVAEKLIEAHIAHKFHELFPAP
jgi:hypothetical protein